VSAQESDYVKGFVKDVWPVACAMYDAALLEELIKAVKEGVDLKGKTVHFSFTPSTGTRKLTVKSTIPIGIEAKNYE